MIKNKVNNKIKNSYIQYKMSRLFHSLKTKYKQIIRKYIITVLKIKIIVSNIKPMSNKTYIKYFIFLYNIFFHFINYFY